MRQRSIWAGIGWWLVLAVSAGAAPDDPLPIRFIHGLQERGYDGLALHYMDTLKAQTGLSSAVKSVLNYERGRSYLALAEVTEDLVDRANHLKRAAALLDAFLRKYGSHPRAPDARIDRARILFSDGRLRAMEAVLPSNSGQRDKLLNEARAILDRARGLFQKAETEFRTREKKFPRHIDRKDKPDVYEQWRTVRNKYTRVRFDKALCGFEKARTYPPTSSQARSGFTAVAREFELIHEDNRVWLGGYYARAYQGRCYLDLPGQDNLNRAMGFFKELLSHEDRALAELHHVVRHFQLIGFNLRGDYELVVDNGTAWLQSNPGRRRTELGRGVLLEVARARVLWGDREARKKNPQDQKTQYMASLEALRDVADSQTAYAGEARVLLQQVQAVTGGKREPQSIDEGIAMAKREIGYNKRGFRATRQNYLTAIGLVRKGLTRRRAEDQIYVVNQGLFLQGYCAYYVGDFYTTAVVGEYVSRLFPKDPQALDAAYLALAGYLQAYGKAKPRQQKEVDLRKAVEACIYIETTWPKSKEADEARLRLAEVAAQGGDLAKAGDAYARMNAESARYKENQLKAARLFWRCYELKAEAKAPAAEAHAMLKKAAAALARSLGPRRDAHMRARQAVEAYNKGVPDHNKKVTEAAKEAGKTVDPKQLRKPKPIPNPPKDVVRDEILLAQIYLEQDQGKAVLALVDPKIQLYQQGKAKEYQDLYRDMLMVKLRAHVGAKDLKQARATITMINKIGKAGAKGTDLTTIYESLARQLEEELTRKKAIGDKGVKKTEDAYVALLNDLSKQKDVRPEVRLWIARSLGSLGQHAKAADEIPKVVQALEQTAATLTKELPKQLPKLQQELKGLRAQAAAKKGDKALADKVKAKEAEIEALRNRPAGLRRAIPRLKLQRVKELRQAKQFNKARTEIKGLVDANPRDIGAQLEQIRVLHDMAANDPKSVAKWLTGAKAAMRLRSRLQLFWEQAPNLRPYFWEALYYELKQRYQLATLGPEAKKVSRLLTARRILFGFKKLSDELGGPELKDKALTIEIQIVAEVAKAEPDRQFTQPRREGKKIVQEKVSAKALLEGLRKEYERWKQTSK